MFWIHVGIMKIKLNLQAQFINLQTQDVWLHQRKIVRLVKKLFKSLKIYEIISTINVFGTINDMKPIQKSE